MRYLNRLWASLADFIRYLAGTGPYAPRERNPQTIETEMMPALLKAQHGKIYPPMFGRHAVIALAVATVLALTIATASIIANRPTPVPVCARYGIRCAPTHTPSPIRHADTSTPKGQ